MQVLVSILMTSYNREKYIAQAIESVINSTYKHWELIIVDDCSQDKTVDIIKEFAAKDQRIKLFINEKNLGQFKNRNKTVEYAQGKYLKFLDSDDLIYPYGLEQLVYYMERNPQADYGLCSIEQDKKDIFPVLLSPQQAYHRHFIEGKWLFHKAPLSSIIKADIYRQKGGFPHEAVSGDFAMWCELSQTCNVLLMPHGIVWYREHSEQEMQKTRDSVFIEFEYLLVEHYYLKHSLCPLSTNDQKISLKNNIQKQSRYIFWKLRVHGLATAWKLKQLQKQKFQLNSPEKK